LVVACQIRRPTEIVSSQRLDAVDDAQFQAEDTAEVTAWYALDTVWVTACQAELKLGQ
jgi:hypothetical protein